MEREIIDPDAMIRKWNDPVLKTVCRDATLEDGRRVGELLSGTVRAFRRRCAGLAAPQIGEEVRVIAARCGHQGPIQVMVNPIIVDHSKHRVTDMEGCMSYPDVFCPVERWEWVLVEYTDCESGERLSAKPGGFFARVVQHEMDHLDGVCKVGDYWRKEASDANP